MIQFRWKGVPRHNSFVRNENQIKNLSRNAFPFLILFHFVQTPKWMWCIVWIVLGVPYAFNSMNTFGRVIANNLIFQKSWSDIFWSFCVVLVHRGLLFRFAMRIFLNGSLWRNAFEVNVLVLYAHRIGVSVSRRRWRSQRWQRRTWLDTNSFLRAQFFFVFFLYHSKPKAMKRHYWNNVWRSCVCLRATECCRNKMENNNIAPRSNAWSVLRSPTGHSMCWADDTSRRVWVKKPMSVESWINEVAAPWHTAHMHRPIVCVCLPKNPKILLS